jgi:protein-S-isoprenylcysteine O-methyltransferase Ste14
MNLFGLALDAVFVLCLALRCRYEVLTRRGVENPGERLVIVAMFVLWPTWFAMTVLDPSSLGVPTQWRWIGLALTVVGAGMVVVAFGHLRALIHPEALVTTGLFTKIRHPVYLAFMLWLVAWPVYQDAAVSLAFGALGIAATLYWRHTEQLNLLEQYGDDYREYMKRTWF